MKPCFYLEAFPGNKWSDRHECRFAVTEHLFQIARCFQRFAFDAVLFFEICPINTAFIYQMLFFIGLLLGGLPVLCLFLLMFLFGFFGLFFVRKPMLFN